MCSLEEENNYTVQSIPYICKYMGACMFLISQLKIILMGIKVMKKKTTQELKCSHPQVVPNLCDFESTLKHNKKYSY